MQYSKALVPIDVILEDVIFTVFKLIHLLNVNSLIDVILDEIVMDVNDSHPLNALVPIEVTDDGMEIDVRFLQTEKALFPIDVMFDVIFTLFKLVKFQSLKP